MMHNPARASDNGRSRAPYTIYFSALIFSSGASPENGLAGTERGPAYFHNSFISTKVFWTYFRRSSEPV